MRRFRHTFFAPWLRDLALMTGAIFFGTWLFGRAVRHGFSHASAVLLVALAWWVARDAARRYGRRTLGKRVERAAQHRLARAARNQAWSLSFNVRCPSGGDIDVFLVGPLGRFTIEIKSWAGLKERRGHLVKTNGRPLRADPVRQCWSEASAFGARPVLWLPQARRRKALVHRGVLIVMGSARTLIKTIERQ